MAAEAFRGAVAADPFLMVAVAAETMVAVAAEATVVAAAEPDDKLLRSICRRGL
jgi:hypothetical protein